jgi:hypothetical protein
MRRPILAALALAALAAPAAADIYPVSGRWGQSSGTEKGAIDCAGPRVISFNGTKRTDSKGGVPNFENKSVQAAGRDRWNVTDIFTTGQINQGQSAYTLRRVDDDILEMDMQPGGLVKLQRCR